MGKNTYEYSEIRNRIFELLKEKKISQKDFATMLGLSPQAISDWKKGINTSFTKYIGKIAEVLQTTPIWLYDGTGEKYFSAEQREDDERTRLLASIAEHKDYENEEVREMRRAYGRLPEIDEAAMDLGRKIVSVLVEANVPYVKALDALEAAENILEGETKPVVIAETPR